ncbi:hypothetical protein ACJJI3_12435 [Microbulbifer sp. ZKSA004]|uniref:RipA family octameric membrane protein n=1 Tax=Microbulbifer sp. ZKSA004 TaxID=3243389 RepID=UPI00403A14D5
MPKDKISQAEYDVLFAGEKKEKALTHALDIRKFETELYWKRATYFWTFIGVIFAGYVAVQSLNSDLKRELGVILSCLGFVFSNAWYCVNRGSKHWQENWEKHVELLEDDVMGPLYKTVLTRREVMSWRSIFHSYVSLKQFAEDCYYKFSHLITGPSQFSVSKINQIISLYIGVVWLYLIYHALPEFEQLRDFKALYFVVVGGSVVASLVLFLFGGRWKGGFWHGAEKRTAKINN